MKRSEGRSAPPARGPDLDQLSRELRLRLAGAALRPSERRWRWAVLGGLVAGLAAGWAASGVFGVAPGQSGVVTRLGAVTVVVGPGLHYHWPAPFGAVRLWPADAQLQTTDAAQVRTRDGDPVDLSYAVRWRVTDPTRLLQGFAAPDAVVQAMALSAVRQAASSTTLDAVTAPGQGGLSADATRLTQAALDRVAVGVHVDAVLVQAVTPPPDAAGVFQDLSAARQQAAAGLREAADQRARLLAAARADAARAVAVAAGARDQEVSEAKGEAARFALIDAQYRKAPAVTRERLYTETMQRVLHDARKVVVQLPPGAQTVLPPDAFRPPEARAAPPPPPAFPPDGPGA